LKRALARGGAYGRALILRIVICQHNPPPGIVSDSDLFPPVRAAASPRCNVVSSCPTVVILSSSARIRSIRHASVALTALTLLIQRFWRNNRLTLFAGPLVVRRINRFFCSAIQPHTLFTSRYHACTFFLRLTRYSAPQATLSPFLSALAPFVLNRYQKQNLRVRGFALLPLTAC